MRRGSIIFCSITLALLVALLAGADGRRPARAAAAPQTPTPSPTPDFSNVTDILGGRRRLFPVDDLVASVQFPDQSNFNVSVKQTENGYLGDENQYPSQVFLNSNFATGTGRVFDQPQDVIVTVTEAGALIANISGSPDPVGYDLSSGGTLHQGALAMADFTGDGYADFAYIQNGVVYIATAKDPKNYDVGLFTSDPGTPTYPVADSDPAALTAGDLDGDGTTELVLAHASGDGVAVDVFDVVLVRNPDTNQLQEIKLSVVGGTYVGTPVGVGEVKLVAGNYTNAVNPSTVLPEEDLVLAYKYRQDGKNHIVDVSSINVTTKSTDPLSLDLVVAGQFKLIDTEVDVSLVGLVSDYLNFFAQTEQVVIGVQEQGYNAYIAVLTFDGALNINQASSQRVLDATKRMLDVAVGNFDKVVSETSPIDLQIAVLSADEESQGWQPALHLFGVDPSNNFALTGLSQGYTSSWIGSAGKDLPRAASLAAADWQGRSLLLGPPVRVTAQHTQPEVILGMPPMHVDWVSPDGTAPPSVFNLSAVPAGFSASYQTSVSNQAQSSRQSTTSFSTALSETVEKKFSLGVPEVASVSVDVKTTAGQMWQNNVSKTYDTYTSTSFDASTTTGFDDQLWYNSERHNIYIYPVIGRVGCPEQKPNCGDAEKVPLNVMFSGPDKIEQTSVGGSTVEWYQPVHEPGNVFSYPWSYDQLQASNPNINLLTSDVPTTFYTDVSNRTEQVKWQSGSTDTVTTGSAQNYSWGTSVSVSGKASLEDEGISFGEETDVSFSYNGSKAFSTLNSSKTTLGASTGIGVQKPGTFPNPDLYQYAVQPFIFGDNPVAGTIQTISLGTDLQTSGILRAAFVADPTDLNAGPWWQRAYTRPDVALNHPSRWTVRSQIVSSPGPNCIRIGSTAITLNCATFNAPDADIWLSEFHWMKGLFITPAESNGEGPQLTQATAGDAVQLRVRVYNYSLADMPARSGVVVQFYAQPWDPSTLQPAGDAFLIENVGIGPLPGFDSSSTGGTLPNWAVASTTKLDTAAYANQYLVFWVLVVPKDEQGRPVAEMPGHGLSGIPPTLNSVAEATTWVEPHGNNLGFYKSLFYIAPPNNAEVSARPGEGELSLARVRVEPRRAVLHEEVSVSALLRSGDQALDGVAVTFYDGDPARGGKAFEHEVIGHIRANEEHQVRVPYRPATCGLHTLYVKTHPYGQVGTARFRVRVRPLPVVHELTRLTGALALPRHDQRYLLGLLGEARRLFRRPDVAGAMGKLGEYREKVEALRGGAIAAGQADVILAQLDLLGSCAGPDAEMKKEELTEDQ